MTAIGNANKLFNSYRNSVSGLTSDYAARVDCDTDTLYSFFVDRATVAPDTTHVFHATFTTAENPSWANRLNLTSPTVATVGADADAKAGVVDFADAVFTGAAVLTGSTSVEDYIVAKNAATPSAAANPVLANYGLATGLPLTPNGADVTVVGNASGFWRY